MILDIDTFRQTDCFKKIIQKYNVDQICAEQLLIYAGLILEWNDKFNLTSKTSLKNIFVDLFADSLSFFDKVDTSSFATIADVGTGSGIPGLVLKIAKPSLNLILIEVCKKKVMFLRHVIEELKLENVTIESLDWRTFNRKTNYPIDCFVTKAAFSDQEIIRMFRQNCSYKTKCIYYWASSYWVPNSKSLPFIKNEIEYLHDGKKMKLVLFSA